MESLIRHLERHIRKGGKDILLRIFRLETPFTWEEGFNSICKDYERIDYNIFMNIFQKYNIIHRISHEEGGKWIFDPMTTEVVRVLREEVGNG